MIEEWDYFKSLCRPPAKAKKVRCLKCGTLFKGSAQNRRCARCKRANDPINYVVS